VEIFRGAAKEAEALKGAVLLPEVANYPKDKIEVIAAVRVKDRLGVRDGDPLTLEFLKG
jgi:CTP-dependent riboflavin kinase